jgi:glutathione S-transferase
MKLYFSPGTCSLSPHIALRESGLPFELVKTEMRSKETADGSDFLRLNPKGYVPALVLDDGEVLTEGPAIVQYIADLAPQQGLAPAPGSMGRYRLQEWLNFIATELHKGFSPLFNPATPDNFKQLCANRLCERLDWLATQLDGRAYLLGEQFTVADGYLFTVLNWSRFVGIDLSRWPLLVAYLDRVRERPAVQAALQAEKAARTIR